LIGFEVADLVLGDPPFLLEVTDLAGNEWLPGVTYSGISLAPTSGDIESKDDFIPALKYGNYEICCPVVAVETSVNQVAALRSEHSLFLSESRVYFRITRSPGKTKLSFHARAIEDPDLNVEVTVRAIGAQGPETSWLHDPTAGDPPWLSDPAYEGAATFVSQPEKLLVPLPASGDDLIVSVAAPWPFGAGLWLDDLSTE
jgi:hypothetical protein